MSENPKIYEEIDDFEEIWGFETNLKEFGAKEFKAENLELQLLETNAMHEFYASLTVKMNLSNKMNLFGESLSKNSKLLFLQLRLLKTSP